MIGDPADHDPNAGRDDCPRCFSTDIFQSRSDRTPHLLSRQCADCGHSWREEA